ncbi:MAG: AraC family transcriptional regulator [Achromobacter sp.]|nr:AraC family transcriptional regulator [Achromobacter sp.]
MAHVHSTIGVDSSRQLLKWQQIMSDVYYRVDIVGDRKHGIRGKLAEQALGRVSLTRFDSDRQRVLRTRAHIASDGDDSYVLVFPETGPLYFEHQGRNGYVQAGGYVMVRSSEYYELSCADNFRNTTIRIPAQALESEYPRAWTHCARAPRGPGEFAGVVRGFAQSAWRLNDASRQRLGPALASEVARLVAILLRGEEDEGDEAGAAEGGRRGTDWLYREIVSRIRGCDAETPLNAAQVAQQLRISPGYVHRILARHATSFGEQLREAHLQQAYEMLADARLNHLTIKEVMYRAGFSNFSHFCYAFRQRFGCTAGELRQRGAAPAVS